jgi:hypothetical protein
MCGPVSPKESLPHVQLAALMSDKMDTSIDSTKLRLFLLAYWNRVTVLAHAIHDQNKGDR